MLTILKTAVLTVAACALLYICMTFAHILCFEDTTFGGWVPFITLGMVGPLGGLAIGLTVRFPGSES